MLLEARATRPPSAIECLQRWNLPENAVSRHEIAAASYSVAFVDGWPTKAGAYCSATFFTRESKPWVMFVIWLDDPTGTPYTFHQNTNGLRYGHGEQGAKTPVPANAGVEPQGVLAPL
jgi:hypothetical protein